MPALQAIQDLCTKYNVKELSSLVDAHAIIKDRISSIRRVVEFSDQIAETKETGLDHTKKHETEVALLNSLVSHRMLLQGKPDETLGHASGAIVFLVA